MKRLIIISINLMLTVLLAAGCLFSGCAREEIFDPASPVSFTVVSGNMDKVTSTKAISEEIENYIHSLNIFVVEDGLITNSIYVRSDNPSTEYTCSIDPVPTSAVIYAVANAEFAENSFNASNLREGLAKAQTEDDIIGMVAEYSASGVNLKRPQGHLLMSGRLTAPSASNRVLYLHHIDASIVFEVAISREAAEKGADFQMTDYQVFNIPKKSYLFDRMSINPEYVPTLPLVYGEEYRDCPWDAVGRNAADDYWSTGKMGDFSVGYDIYTSSLDVEVRRRVSQFDFYMLENRKLALASTGNGYPADYGKREDRVSDDDRTFAYADKYSTYVLIRGTFRYPDFDYDLSSEVAEGGVMTVPDKVSRVANVEYTVHLGDFDSVNNPEDAYAGSNNFFTDRSTRYTYKVSVLNARDIAVEAIKNVEKSPGAEGSVLDSHHAAFGDVDAHFASMVIAVELPRLSDGSLDMSYFTDPLKCLVSDCPYGEDYSWIQFAPMNKDEVARQKDGQPEALTYEFCKNDSRMVSMVMLPDWFINNCNPSNEGMINWIGLTPNTNTGNNKVWFTVFVDENYPQAGHRNEDIYKCSNHGNWGSVLFWPGYGPEETPSCAAMQGRSGLDPQNMDWRNYINVRNREFRLFNDNFISNDSASDYSLSRIYVTQKSIQTYYDIASMAEDSKALGVEHVDEPGKMLHHSRELEANDGSYPVAYPVGVGLDDEDGLTASRCWFKGLSSLWNWSCDGTENINSVQRDNGASINSRWDHWLDLTRPTIASQFIEPANSADAWHELLFLQRNRDVNANGIIDLDEIRWYNPSYFQLEDISMNANALVTPLYDRSLPATVGPGVSVEDPLDRTRDRHIMWYITSSLAQIWVDEVTSGGLYISDNISRTVPNMNDQENYMRCVRNIGSNAFDSCPPDPRMASDTKAPAIYSRNELSIVPVNISQAVLREPIYRGELVPMQQFDKFNSMSRTGFTVADMSIDEYYPAPTMEQLDLGQSPCKDYWEGSEDDPRTGKGCWRTPNSMELTVMMMTKVLVRNQGWSKKAGYEYPMREDSGKYTLSLMSCTKYSWAYAIDDTGLHYSLTPTCDKDGNPVDGSGYTTWHAAHQHHFLTFMYDGIRLSDSNYWLGVTTAYWQDNPVSHRLRCVRDN